MLETGQKAPTLKGVVQDGTTLALADLRGHPVVVYFYPKDNTPGCTSQALAFRDLYARFRAHACQIVGVSRDSVASHAKFRDKHALPFPLVADTDESWCTAFGVLGEKVLYGKRHIGVIRSTFLLDANGVVAALWRHVKVPGHAQAVLERLAHS
ncbi:MAG: peroxiredoxin [Rhodanobacter sp.]|jgi:peroxiredoxin Q/BCP|nr:peroxiredoxin [Rhodanobacter sp.]